MSRNILAETSDSSTDSDFVSPESNPEQTHYSLEYTEEKSSTSQSRRQSPRKSRGLRSQSNPGYRQCQTHSASSEDANHEDSRRDNPTNVQARRRSPRKSKGFRSQSSPAQRPLRPPVASSDSNPEEMNNSRESRRPNPTTKHRRQPPKASQRLHSQPSPVRPTRAPPVPPTEVRQPHPPTQRRRKQKTPISAAQRERRFLLQLRDLQCQTTNFIPKLPFSRVVSEILISFSTTVQRITPEALAAIQEATEMYLTQQFNDAYLLTLHRGRVTLMPKDMELLRLLSACLRT